MYSRVAFALLFAVCAFDLGIAYSDFDFESCGPYEEYRKCASACYPTCAHPEPGFCTHLCMSGCFCLDGFLRNSTGQCVLPQDCQPRDRPGHEILARMFETPVDRQCLENEEFRECKGCDGTCANPNPVCAKVCRPGCACKKSHLRSDVNGRCIPAHTCPSIDSNLPEVFAAVKANEKPTCPLNEYYSECGTACPATCANPKPGICISVCRKGCFCKPGLLRNALGVCVPRGDCATVVDPTTAAVPQKATCPRNEYFDQCGTACPATCADPKPEACIAVCKPGCFCKPGLLRNARGACVPNGDCVSIIDSTN